MKKIYTIFALASLIVLSSCELTLYPETGYNQGNVDVKEDASESQYNTREDMKGLRDAIYSSWTKDIQEKGYLDWLVYAECRADNAYGGNPGTGEVLFQDAARHQGERRHRG